MPTYQEVIKDINDLDGNYWIKANAGSGKTYKLTARIVFLLQNGIKPEDILCITYTNAGADEMKKRIVDKINQKEVKEKLFLQNGFTEERLEYIKNHLQISTIHGFCKDYLQKQNKIKPNALILNNDERQMNNIIDSVIKSISRDKNYTDIVSKSAGYFSITDYQNIIKKIIENQNKFRELSANVFDNFDSFYKLSLVEQQRTIKQLLPNEVCELVDCNITDIENCLLEQLKGFSQSELNDLVIAVFKRSMDKAQDIMQTDLYDLENWEELVLSSGKPRKTLPKVGTDLQNLWKGIQNYYVKKNDKISADLSFLVLNLAVAVLYNYEKIKQDNNIITYDDMLYETKKMADKGALPRIKYIMLDEAQDTNPLCWEIIEKFCDKDGKASKIFVVGDVKQSIYSFQGANLEYYYRYYNVFKNRTPANQWHDEVALIKSYRSVGNVLRLADSICNNNKMAFGDGEEIRHFSTRSENYDIHIENILSEEDDKENKPQSWLEIVAHKIKQQEKNDVFAEEVAGKIYEITKQGASTAIIVPKRNTSNGLAFDIIGKLQEIEDCKVKLQPELAVKHLYFQDLMCVLRFCVLQLDDINLGCLLKSEFFHLTDDILQTFANSKGCLFERMQEYGWNDEIKLVLQDLNEVLKKQKCSEIIEWMAEQIKAKSISKYEDYFTLLKKIFAVYTEEGGIDYDIRAFIMYVENGGYKDKSDNNVKDGVYFSTIHGVKGLEFDNVILLDLEKKKNTKKDNMMFFFEKEKNSFFYYQKALIGFDCDELSAKIQKEANKQEMESLRLLYVAITRTKDRFYYFGNTQSTFGNVISTCSKI